MSTTFAITAASNSVQLDSTKREGVSSFTVSNTSGQEIWGRAKVETVPPAEKHINWLTISSEAERQFNIAGTQQYTVQIKVPADAPAGNYTFRLNMIGVALPDEQFAEGPTVTFAVPAAPIKKKFPWWILLVAGFFLVLVVGLVAFLLFRPRPIEVPELVGLSQAEAAAALAELGLSAQPAGQESSDLIPAGDVVRSDPAAGTEVEEESTIAIFTSSGPATTPTPTPPPATATPTPVPGAWSGTWLIQCDLLPCTEMELQQSGNNVSGTFAEGNGTIEGTVNGNRLAGTLSLFGATSPVEFWLDAGGAFWQGNWNRLLAWCGYRASGAAPEPCGIASWAGNWTTECSSACGSMILFQDGQRVFGSYAGGDGQIEGTVNGPSLSGTWSRGSGTGTVELFIIAEGEGRQFNGNWDNSTGWCGFRDGSSLPATCTAGIGFVFDPDLFQPVLPGEFELIMPDLLPLLTPTP